jgi:dual specificity protein kinase YAK1
MQVDVVPQHKRRASGFKRVRDARDLRPYVNTQPAGRRMDSTGTYLSPLRQLTTNILDTYHICNPQFRYESTHNPRRVLTKPSKPAHNEGYDNDDYDYILYVNDWLGTEEGHKYLILDILGQGTFGQVVKCQNMKTHEIVAVKVVKNKPAYFNQSMMEVTILELLNNQCDPQDEHHILRLRDSFIHRSHLCLVFELLSSNLYELIKQNQFQGLSTQLVKVFTAQLLDAMTVLKDARLIHCDLKPENILLKSLQSPQIKVIDFGSACHERQTVYTYIQSRFYRSPEVLLGIPYTASIDMWSLGCIAVELFLGLPLFPGTSEYNQITRIVEMVGMPPSYMLDIGKQTNQFFDSYVDHYGQKKYRLKTLEQYSREHNTNEQPGKQYFKANSLPEIIDTAPMPTFKSSARQSHEMDKELNNRASFIDFCQGLLNLNPIERWSPQQARMHPFITGEKFTRPFTPTSQVQQTVTPAAPPAPGADPKRPYGGLVPSQPKGTRAYQDAASYNHHLAQHQAYTAQAQAATQAANNAFRNPYITPQSSSQSSSSSYAGSQDSTNSSYSSQQPHSQQHSTGQLAVNTSIQSYPNHPSAGGAGGLSVPSNLGPAPPSNTYYSNSRGRANTINQMDAVPPALARLQHMNQDVIAGRNALTPVLNRDDAMREWERRQAGKPPAAPPYPQLEFLQQQAELAAASGLTNWAQQPPPVGRYQPPTSKLSHSYAPTIVIDDDRQNTVMASVRAAARTDGSNNAYASSAAITSPPQAYTSNSATANRYAYPQQQTPTSPFDSLDRRTDIGNLFVPMQPDHYQSYNNAPPSSVAHSQQGQPRNIVPPPQAAAPSFYGGGAAVAGVAAQGQSNNAQQRNPFSANNPPQPGQSTEGNRAMDVWPR